MNNGKELNWKKVGFAVLLCFSIIISGQPISIAYEPSISATSLPTTVDFESVTPVTLTYENIGSITLEKPAYYWDGAALAINQPDLLPGDSMVFSVNVNSSGYSPGDVIIHIAKICGMYGGNQHYLNNDYYQIFTVETPPEGYTIYVDDDNTEGPWDGTQEHPYQHIQEGIDNASTGNTVFVYNGIYQENALLNKSINLIGEDKNNTIIDEMYGGDVV